MKDRMFRLFRRRVEVLASGIIYNGLFLGADDEYLYMIGPMSYLTIPLELVSAVREEGAGEGDWLRKEVEGEEARTAAEDKRRYSKETFERFFAVAAPAVWPGDGTEEDPDKVP